MSLRGNLWIFALALGGMAMSGWADGAAAPAPAPPKPIVRTYVFPANGFAYGTETVRVTVINIAPNAHNGTLASCNGTILFHDGGGKTLLSKQFTKLLSNQIASVDYPDPANPPVVIQGVPISRGELQGLVQVSIDPAAMAPCSLLLTLEVFDSVSKQTYALITSAVEQPLSVIPVGFGRGPQ